MLLQMPVNADCSRPVAVTPYLSPSSTCSSVPENCPDYQRVTISGDYCAGVSTVNINVWESDHFAKQIVYLLLPSYGVVVTEYWKTLAGLQWFMFILHLDHSGGLWTFSQKSVKGSAYSREILKASLSSVLPNNSPVPPQRWEHDMEGRRWSSSRFEVHI